MIVTESIKKKLPAVVDGRFKEMSEEIKVRNFYDSIRNLADGFAK